MKATTADPSKRLEIFARKDASFDKVFSCVYASDQEEYDLTGWTFRFDIFDSFLKEPKLSLGMGTGITVTGNEIAISMTPAQLDFKKEDNFYFLWGFLSGKTYLWLNGRFVLNNKLFNGVDNTDTLTISLDAEDVVIELSISGGSGGAVDDHFLGKYISLAALESAHPTADDGDYAVVDPGSGTEALQYIWDAEEGWVSTGPAPEVDWDDIQGKPSTFPPSAHTHDWSAITGKPSTFPPSAHTHDWNEIEGKPATFPPSSHTHDQRYNPNEVNYGSTALALAAYPEGSRRVGLTLLVNGDEYWFRGGILNQNFVKKGDYSGYDILFREDFIRYGELLKNVNDNFIFAGGNLEVFLAGTTAYPNTNNGAVPAPGFLGALGLAAQASDPGSSIGIAVTDGGAGFFDGASTNKWNKDLGMIVRICVNTLQNENESGLDFSFAFGVWDGVDNPYAAGFLGHIEYTSGSPNWIIRHRTPSGNELIDTEIPVTKEWLELRVDILKEGYLIYYINGTVIFSGVYTPNLNIGPRLTVNAGDGSVDAEVSLDWIKVIEYLNNL